MSQTQTLLTDPLPWSELPSSCLDLGNSLLVVSASPTPTLKSQEAAQVTFWKSSSHYATPPVTSISLGIKAKVCMIAYKVLVSSLWTSAPTHHLYCFLKGPLAPPPTTRQIMHFLFIPLGAFFLQKSTQQIFPCSELLLLGGALPNHSV